MSEELNRDYQEHLLARMMKEIKFTREIAPLISADIFDEDLAQAVQFLLVQFQKTGKTPNAAQIRQYIPNTRLPTPGKCPVELDVEAVTKFSKSRKLRASMMQASQLLQAGEIEEAMGVLGKSGRGLGGQDSSGFDFFTDTKVTASRGESLPTGQKTLDAVTGGVCRGEMALVMAPSNGGKSAWLVHVAALAVQKGMNVFFASLEMPAHAMKMRFEQKFSTMRLNKKKRGNLWIHCSSPNTVTPMKLNSLIDKLESPPDVIVIDSGDLMAAPRKWGSQWEEETELFQDMKGLALDHNAIMWVATQANRTGYGNELIDLKNVKGAITKIQICDQVISLNQDESEAMVDPETGECVVRAYLPKNRFGPKGVISTMLVRFEICEFCECEDSGYG